MSISPKVISAPDEVENRLWEIGRLTTGLLQSVALVGEQARGNCPSNWPVTAPGTLAYFARVGALRDQLKLQGWVGKCLGGAELVVYENGEHAIVVAAGDENTGNDGATPKTKRRKGIRMKEAADINSRQFDLFTLLDPDAVRLVKAQRDEAPAMLTWVFLVHRGDGVLTLELSLLGDLGPDGRGAFWLERILIQGPPLDGSAVVDAPDDTGPEPDAEPQVGVHRRQPLIA